MGCAQAQGSCSRGADVGWPFLAPCCSGVGAPTPGKPGLDRGLVAGSSLVGEEPDKGLGRGVEMGHPTGSPQNCVQHLGDAKRLQGGGLCQCQV